MSNLKVGAATRIINCKVGDPVSGMLEPRFSDRIKDDLEANAFCVSEGGQDVLIINCDLLHLTRNFIDKLASKISNITDIPAENVIICCTHTHSGPYTTMKSVWGPANEEYMDSLEKWLVEVAVEAMNKSVSARVGYGLGKTRIGYNRRVCWKDGSHSMYGNTKNPGFAGLEGPDDPSHAVLYALDNKGKIICVIHNNACHATTGCAFKYVSSDFPGASRRLIRDALGDNVPLLYIQGACGDICRFNQLKQEGLPDIEGLHDAERRLKEISILLAGQTLKLIKETPVCYSPVVKHLFREIKVGIRMPSEEMLKRAKAVVETGPNERPSTNNIEGGYGFQKGILDLHEKYKDNPYEQIPLHALRIGGFALATVPCELYSQFGIDIKRRSPAEITAVAELTHGALGYCPTIYGILGGGYSGATYFGSKLEPFAGYKMVEELSIMLYELFGG
ncbi:MAG TPA: hypothetical protein PKN36_03310 [bacterium]|nr:hypothetical protein [bacterium]